MLITSPSRRQLMPKTLLTEMIQIAEQYRGAPSPKVLALIDWISRNQCQAVSVGGVQKGTRKKDREWNDKRLIIFTEYADTKRYLRHQLNAAIDGTEDHAHRIIEFHGGMSDEQREEGSARVQRTS